MKRISRRAFDLAAPGLPLVMLAGIVGLDALFHVATVVGATLVASGMGLSLLGLALLTGPMGNTPSPAPIWKRHLPWGIGIVAIGLILPLFHVQYWGAGLIFLGALYVAASLVSAARRQSLR